MVIEERQRRILELLREEPEATVKALAGALYVSEPTLRRDLTELEKKGLLRKVYGGARLTAGPADREIPYILREKEKGEVKARLGRQAASHVRDGMVLMLDGSTSAYHLIPYLTAFRDLIVVTSGAKAALALAEANIRVYSTGGEMIVHSFSYVGRQAEDFVRAYNADICFFSCRGMDGDGLLTDLAVQEVNLRRAMMEQSQKRVLLLSSEKLGKRYFYTQGRSTEVDAIVCDAPLPLGVCLRET